MKKIIICMAAAMLTASVAQAQEKVRKMIVRTQGGEVQKFATDGVSTVEFEEALVPTTVAEAEAMLPGCYKYGISSEEMPEDWSDIYIVITDEMQVWQAIKVPADATDEELASFAGKTIGVSCGGEAKVKTEDPTQATIEKFVPFIKNIQDSSIDLATRVDEEDDVHTLNVTCERVESFTIDIYIDD